MNMFKKYWYIFVGIFIILGLTLSLIFLRSGVTFNVHNNSHVYVELNNEYNYDVKACYGNKIIGCKDVEVKHTGEVDTSKIGKTDIIYYTDYKGHNEITTHVHVIDKTAPVINTESTTISVCPNEENYNINYTAQDNYDGDITEKVMKKTFDNKIMLLVLDNFYNSDLKIIDVIKEDTENPTITLNGSNDISIALNSKYNDQGYTAQDNCDGDLTEKVTVNGKVDTSNTGKYELTYTVSDTNGNNTSVTRHINVYKPNGNRVIYLTFDDGPSPYTGELLDTLAKYNVKATFFVTGRAPSYNYNIKRAFDEGHAVALHTNTHNYNQIYSSIDAYFDDLNTISETVHSLTGEYSKLIRFPGGSSNTVSKITPGIMTNLSRMVTEKGYKYFDWNVSSGDASGKTLTSDEYANNVIKSLGNGSYYIVLQHDTNANSVRAVGKIIEYGLNNGYRFDKLSTDSPTVHHKIAN